MQHSLQNVAWGGNLPSAAAKLRLSSVGFPLAVHRCAKHPLASLCVRSQHATAFICMRISKCESWLYKYKVLKMAFKGRKGRRAESVEREGGTGCQLKGGDKIGNKTPSGIINLFFII